MSDAERMEFIELQEISTHTQRTEGRLSPSVRTQDDISRL